jgi:hypothetical protein
MNITRRSLLKMSASVTALAVMPVSIAFEKIKEFTGITIKHYHRPCVIDEHSYGTVIECNGKSMAEVTQVFDWQTDITGTVPKPDIELRVEYESDCDIRKEIK